ncbi:DUF1810 domain-containing protein [Flavobacterium sp. DG1-102-2]|uniref:DUF1810 domain-containing protein n=1 Tax=Flavobacterium sp. DG1-102-2 TaxID=3081663 RepID=UPI00294905FE|nr:DUF1810 domain-containing protein [Flavobacterium sp. DG1-102-2]MDV6167123.1 DUF1810 domain-containing protein [Flavobacterium sp. DG1-102-2]
MPDKDLVRFLEAQNQMYLTALTEIKKGSKKSHWMWFIFPQLEGLGSSENARYFGIKGMDEARQYLKHPVLGKHLIEISNALLEVKGKTALEILGSPDNLKLRSCMTLFATLEDTDPVFKQVLEKYFEGIPDRLTLSILLDRH